MDLTLSAAAVEEMERATLVAVAPRRVDWWDG